jgi:hypothetical protein
MAPARAHGRPPWTIRRGETVTQRCRRVRVRVLVPVGLHAAREYQRVPGRAAVRLRPAVEHVGRTRPARYPGTGGAAREGTKTCKPLDSRKTTLPALRAGAGPTVP